ncbi:MAG: TonB-dependent receptor [Rhodobacteraceae bacterium]|nr:TonB-dependent receptor [Paracoccaceae bacterium]
MANQTKSAAQTAKLIKRLRATTMFMPATLGAALLAGLLTGGAQPALAADGAERVAPISVTATRTPMEAFSVPGMVTVKGAREIADEIPSSLGDLFDNVPGVTAVGGPRRTGEVPTIRGFSGPDVIVTIDGTRQNFISGHDGRVFVDPSFLGGLEIVRGSSSALYGSGGTGGVIALRTLTADDLLNPGERFGVTFGTSYRTGNDEISERVLAYGKPAEGVDLFAGLVLRQSDDIRLADGFKLDSDDDIISGLVKGTFDLGRGQSVRLSWQRISNDAREPGNGQDATGTLTDKDSDNETFSLAYTMKPSDQNLIDLEIQAYKSINSVDEVELEGASAGAILERSLETLGFGVTNTSRFMLSDDVALALTAGFEVYREDAAGARDGGVRGGVVSGEQDFSGYFVQTAFTWFSPFGLPDGELSLTPGVRYDSFENTDATGTKASDSQVSPKVTARFAPVEWGFVYGSYADAFRAPRLDELFPTGVHFPAFGPGGLTGFNTFISNATLKPQSTSTLEFGAGLEFEDIFDANDIFQVKAGYYTMDGEDFLSTEVIQNADLTNPQFFAGPLAPGFTCFAFVSTATNPLGCGGTTQIVNIPDAAISGFELDATYDASRWRMQVGAQTMETENTATGEPIGIEQADQITVDVRVKLPEFASFLGWRATFANALREGTTTADFRDSYQLHEIYARWRPEDGPLSGFSLGVTAENLFDEEYQRVSSSTLEEGRSILVDLTYSLKW